MLFINSQEYSIKKYTFWYKNSQFLCSTQAPKAPLGLGRTWVEYGYTMGTAKEELKAAVTEKLQEVNLTHKKHDFVHLLFNEGILQFPKIVATM